MTARRLRFVVSAALLIVTAGVGQQALYEKLVVPTLPHVDHVPAIWWAVLGTPLILTGLGSGWMARCWSETLAIAGLGAFGLRVFGEWAAQCGRPGSYKGVAIEAPLEYWTLGFLSVFLLLLILIVLAWRGHVALRTPQTAG